MEERDVKMWVIQLHAAGKSDRQIERETKVPKSTVWRWIKPFKEILEEIAERFGKKSFSNRYIKREYASQSPDMVVAGSTNWQRPEPLSTDTASSGSTSPPSTVNPIRTLY